MEDSGRRTPLQRFVLEGSEAGFEEIVREHLDLVYSTALRVLDGRQDLAADATQNVFIAFTRKAPSLLGTKALAPWFHRAARLAALEVRRGEQRRLERERRAGELTPMDTTPDTTGWEEVWPVLDEALDQLRESDRQALILRFFQQQSFNQMGQTLGVSEDSARMRTQRALEVLRQRLARRQITSTAAALSSLLTAHAVSPAPAALAATVVAALPISLVTPVTLSFMSITTSSTIKWAALVVIASSLAVPLALQVHRNGVLEQERAQLADALEKSRAELEEARSNSANLLAEVSDTQSVQEGIKQLRKDVLELRDQVANRPPPGVARETSHPEKRDTEAVLKEGPKVVIFGEINAVVPLAPNVSPSLAEVLARLPRSEFADLRRVRVYRSGDTGGNTTNVVNVESILRRVEPDFNLADGDRVEIRPRTFNF